MVEGENMVGQLADKACAAGADESERIVAQARN
jgi:hypothetical protein